MAEGVEFGTDGKRILWRNSGGRITPEIIAELRAAKGEIIAFLQRSSRPTSVSREAVVAECRLMEFEERAAILEYDQGLSRADAETLAHVLIYGVPARRNSRLR